MINTKPVLIAGFSATALFCAALALYGLSLSADGAAVFSGLGLAGVLAAVLGLVFSLKAADAPARLIAELAEQMAQGRLDDAREATPAGALGQAYTDLLNTLGTRNLRLEAAEGVLENLPMPFLMVDTEERVLRSNQATLDMLELDGSITAQYGRKLAEVFYNDPTRPTAVGKSINNGERFVNLDVQISGHKGGTVDVLANVFPLYGQSGDCIGGFCIYLDMTDNKDKERQIIEQHRSITETAERAGQISANTTAAAEELSAQVDQTTAGAEQQSRRTQEVATALEQMTASVIEVARNSGHSAEQAKQASSKAQSGWTNMEDTLNSMSRLREQSDTLKNRLGSLGQQAESIGAVMSVITDIADQTNLLALNAAIEAARAGDAGRGFAVVADEVRKLAEKTTSATQEVGDAVARIQQESAANMQAMDVTLTSIDESSSHAELAGEALREIVTLVGDTTEQILAIATASEEQSATVEEISSTMEDINSISQETADAMAQAAQAVLELSRLTQDLNTVIEGLNA